MLFAEVARVSREVARTSARSRKTALLAEFFRAAEPAGRARSPSPTWPAGCRRGGSASAGRRCGTAPAPAAEPTLTVAEVDAALTARRRASRARARRPGGGGCSRSCWRAATAAEQEFLIGLITGEVRQGALDAAAAEGLAAATGAPAADVRRAVMLRGVARTGRAGAAGARPGRAGRASGSPWAGPLLPMLRGVREVRRRGGREGWRPCAVEEKLDGIRVQVHRDGDGVRVFTRTLDDITDRLPEVAAPCAALDGRPVRPGRRGAGLRRGRAAPAVPGDRGPGRLARGRRGGGPRAAAVRRSSSTCSPSTARICSTCRTPSGTRRWTRWCPSRAAGAAGGRRRPGGRGAGRRRRTSWRATLERGPRGRGGQGRRQRLRGRAARRLLDQGQAGPHAGPGGAGRRVGPRPAHRQAVQPAPGGARRGRLVRHARQDVQGPDGRDAGLADRAAAGAAVGRRRSRGDRPAGTGGGDRLRRVPDLAPATRRGSPCGSPA